MQASAGESRLHNGIDVFNRSVPKMSRLNASRARVTPARPLDAAVARARTAQLTMLIPREQKETKALGTALIVLGCLIAGLTLPSGGSELSVYRYCSYVLGAFLVISLLVEGKTNFRRLVRTDIVAIVSLYFLTFAEFLHPDVRILYDVPTENAALACQLVLAATAALAIGRHLPLPFGRRGAGLPHVGNSNLLWIFASCLFLGYLWPLISVGFNPVELVNEMFGPRFSQPWVRGREGGWTSFLTELNLLLYIAAALAGYIVAKRKVFGPIQRLTVLLLTTAMLLFDVAEGTRNVVIIKMGLIMAAIITANPKSRNGKTIVLVALATAAAWGLSGEMLKFRNVGFESYVGSAEAAQEAGPRFMIDNNLITIARAVRVFPSLHEFPGSDIVVSALTKWVPRALWPGKPTEWGTSLETAFGVGEGYTLAVTFVGEAYLISGIPSLLIVSLLLGSLCATWNRVGETARSNLDLLLYLSGFFAAALAMRSIQFLTVALVPTLAIYVLGRLLRGRRE